MNYSVLMLFPLLALSVVVADEATFKPLFNGKDLEGWARVNTDEEEYEEVDEFDGEEFEQEDFDAPEFQEAVEQSQDEATEDDIEVDDYVEEYAEAKQGLVPKIKRKGQLSGKAGRRAKSLRVHTSHAE